MLVWTCTENGRKQNCVGWFGHVQRMEENRIVWVGLDMYREWKEIELYVLVWTCTENGRKQNSQKGIIQGVSQLEDITAGGDFLGLCDQKSSYKCVSDFGRLRSYGQFLIPVHTLV